jgi:hypothetical protein
VLFRSKTLENKYINQNLNSHPPLKANTLKNLVIVGDRLPRSLEDAEKHLPNTLIVHCIKETQGFNYLTKISNALKLSNSIIDTNTKIIFYCHGHYYEHDNIPLPAEGHLTEIDGDKIPTKYIISNLQNLYPQAKNFVLLQCYSGAVQEDLSHYKNDTIIVTLAFKTQPYPLQYCNKLPTMPQVILFLANPQEFALHYPKHKELAKEYTKLQNSSLSFAQFLCLEQFASDEIQISKKNDQEQTLHLISPTTHDPVKKICAKLAPKNLDMSAIKSLKEEHQELLKPYIIPLEAPRAA